MGLPSRKFLNIIITKEDGLLDLSKCLIRWAKRSAGKNSSHYQQDQEQ